MVFTPPFGWAAKSSAPLPAGRVRTVTSGSAVWLGALAGRFGDLELCRALSPEWGRRPWRLSHRNLRRVALYHPTSEPVS